jgi:hypothetical protein
MNEAELGRKLADYADGEAEPEVRRVLEERLASDAASREVVARWQALRRSAQRAVFDEPVPAGLADRIRARLPGSAAGRSVSRFYRIGTGGLAMAAVFVLAVLIWPRGAAGTPVEAAGFVGVYEKCAIKAHHDEYAVRGEKTWSEFADGGQRGCMVTLRRKVPFEAPVPDLGQTSAYRLVGACSCSPSDAVHVVHTYFRCAEGPENIVSLFTVDHRVRLCHADGSACDTVGGGVRKYAAVAVGRVSVVSWNERRRAYVMCCGRLGTDELMQMADQLTIAQLEEVDRAARVYLASLADR